MLRGSRSALWLQLAHQLLVQDALVRAVLIDDEQTRFGGGHDVLVLQLKQRPLLHNNLIARLELRADFTRSRRLHGMLFVRHRPSFALGLPCLFVQGLPRIHLATIGPQPAA